LVGAVEWIVPWYGLADLGAADGIALVRGQALSRQAMHGGKATHAQSDAPKMAARLRGGRLPQAAVYPAAMRAPRALLRRRPPLRRQRAALVAHVQPTPRQYHWPELGKHSADHASRDGGAERLADPAGQQHSAGAWALRTEDEPLRSDGDLVLVKAAQHQDAHTRSRWHTVPGLGNLRSRGLLDALHALEPCPRGQDGVSAGRLGTWARESAGNRWGTSGQTLGTAPLTWACADAATLFVRPKPAGQKSLGR
jgi:hypothetical protein